jgi:hypothetical protein
MALRYDIETHVARVDDAHTRALATLSARNEIASKCARTRVARDAASD